MKENFVRGKYCVCCWCEGELWSKQRFFVNTIFSWRNWN